LLLESAQWKENLEKEHSITVNQAKFFEVMKQRKDQIKKFEKLDKFSNGLSFAIYPQEVERQKTDEAFKKKTENWTKMLGKDLYLQEAVNIISEMIKA
jgi:carboxyl-terminal processing protease